MKRKLTLVLSILLMFAFLLRMPGYGIQSENVSSPAFVARFTNGSLATSFGTLSTFTNFYFGPYGAGGYVNMTTAADASDGTLHFINNLGVPSINSAPLADCYSYKRAEVYNRTATKLKSRDGFSIQYRLKLSMTRLTTLSATDGLGWTGFLVDVRDYFNGAIDNYGNLDNEFYLGIAAYQNGIVATSVSGNRNNLRNQAVYYYCFPNINPNEYHTYTWVYMGGSTFALYIDGVYKCDFSNSYITHRSVYSGFYYNDYVGLSLVNRTGNAVASGSSYLAASEAWLDYIRIYNTVLYRSSLLGIYDYDYNVHAHTLYFDDISSSLSLMGFSNEIDVYDGSYSKQEVINLLTNSRILLFRGHGKYVPEEDRTRITIKNSLPNSSEKIRLYSDELNSASPDLSNTDLVLYIGCETALGNDTDPNSSLMKATLDAGAKTVVGFKTEIGCESASNFSKHFFNYLQQGNTVKDACEQAYEDVRFGNITVPAYLGDEYLFY